MGIPLRKTHLMKTATMILFLHMILTPQIPIPALRAIPTMKITKTRMIPLRRSIWMRPPRLLSKTQLDRSTSSIAKNSNLMKSQPPSNSSCAQTRVSSLMSYQMIVRVWRAIKREDLALKSQMPRGRHILWTLTKRTGAQPSAVWSVGATPIQTLL